MKTILEVFDPAMCCSTGVCGPNVEPKLVHFAADLDWLKSQGVEVKRYNLAHQPAEFARQAIIKDLLTKSGTAGLPAIVVDGVLASQARYPSRTELAAIAGVKAQASNATNAGMTEQTREFIALGAAVGSNCEACFDFQRGKLVRLGVSAEDLSAAVDIAQQVKAAADANLRRLIQHRTSEKDSGPSACCGGSSAAVKVGIKAKSKTTCCGG
jgi:AhpD family alkylhydroperoxidase